MGGQACACVPLPRGGRAGAEDFAGFQADIWAAPARSGTPKPRVIIPTFPGTNCEVDTARALERAGAEPVIALIRQPHRPTHVARSVDRDFRADRSRRR